MGFMISIHLLTLHFFTELPSFCPLQCRVHLQCIWSVYRLNQRIPKLNTLQSETPLRRGWGGGGAVLYSGFRVFQRQAGKRWPSGYHCVGKGLGLRLRDLTKKETKHHIQLKGGGWRNQRYKTFIQSAFIGRSSAPVYSKYRCHFKSVVKNNPTIVLCY